MIIPYDVRKKSFDAEFMDDWSARKFERVLEVFGLDMDDFSEINPEYIGNSVIRFWCNEEKRKQIEYVYRRVQHMEPLYLMDLNCYQNNHHKLEEDHYVIF